MATTWTNPASNILPSGVLTRDKPITHIRASVAELQAKCPVRVKIEIKGLTAAGRIQGNTLLLSGDVNFPKSGGRDNRDPAGGDDTKDGDGSGGGDPPPSELFSGDVFALESLAIDFESDGESLILTPTATGTTLTFEDGLCTGVADGQTYQIEQQIVSGVSCE